jgi:ABC-type transport system involved in multi-copper enzyme maturation permease subunit
MCFSIDKNLIHTLSRYYFKTFMRLRGFYWVLSFALLFVVLLINYLVELVNIEFVVVISSPFDLPIKVFSVILLIFLSLSIGNSVIRDKQSGVHELFFSSPISIEDYLLGLSFGVIKVSVLIFGIFLIFLYVLSLFTGLKLSISIVLMLIYSVIIGFPFLGLSLLISIMTRSARNFILLFTLVFGLLFSLAASDLLLISIITEKNFDSLIIVRDVITNINRFLQWISPFELLFNGFNAIDSKMLFLFMRCSIVSILLYILFVFLSKTIIRKNGII